MSKTSKRVHTILKACGLAGLFGIISTSAFAELGNAILIGKVPGRYLTGKAINKSYLSKVIIENGIIKEVTPITKSEIAGIQSGAQVPVVVLGQAAKDKFDVIYPGLFDLHNHTKQNMLPLWGEAHGQFANRFEWRDWSHYTEAVSQNMNPWIKDYGTVVECAAFRWSELQAMVLGTTYLQGPSSCVSNFAIHHVEGGDGFLYDKKNAAGEPVIAKLNVQAPTDVVDPDSFTFIWAEVKPLVDKGDSFSKALQKVLFNKCPSLKEPIEKAYKTQTEALTAKRDAAKAQLDKKRDAKTMAALEIAEYELKREVMMDKEVLKIITDKPLLEKSCSDVHPKFLRYMSFFHPTIAGKIYYINHPHHSSIIGHLTEGRRIDPYNQVEFDLLRIIGLDQKNVNLIHAVGINNAGLKHMAKQGMGIIWSPFSNFLLYGQTADIAAAHKAGVMLALGSDWTPTGSKSVLEELKIARNYLKQEGMNKIFTDEYLYRMVTENPAKMINQLEEKAGDGHHGAGKVVADAVASIIVVKENKADPHTNLVTATAGDINLVVITGSPLYGNVKYLKSFNPEIPFEVLPRYFKGLNELVLKDSTGAVTGVSDVLPLRASGEEPGKILIKIASSDFLRELEGSDQCKFSEQKGLVNQDSLANNSNSSKPAAKDNLVALKKETGLNLDRASDIQKLLGALLLTQGKNLNGEGTLERAISYMPSLFSCNDSAYSARFAKFMSDSKTKADEYKANKEFRIQFRKDAQDKIDEYNKTHAASPRMSNPEKMAKDYGLEYDSHEGVYGY
ncbi:MAG: hypothetical protein A2X86_01325 [Bdellovibrionales bacterium GWA2_49_15]|nr:MAG: hypothetical protein A2X86_01325 [Bdellovibrionales bacterium GWA2_49_15]